jgi:hypothetical protein
MISFTCTNAHTFNTRVDRCCADCRLSILALAPRNEVRRETSSCARLIFSCHETGHRSLLNHSSTSERVWFITMATLLLDTASSRPHRTRLHRCGEFSGEEGGGEGDGRERGGKGERGGEGEGEEERTREGRRGEGKR